ncbi:hypothetical protein ACJJTC_007564 [Scirpophaga incertulas]
MDNYRDFGKGEVPRSQQISSRREGLTSLENAMQSRGRIDLQNDEVSRREGLTSLENAMQSRGRIDLQNDEVSRREGLTSLENAMQSRGRIELHNDEISRGKGLTQIRSEVFQRCDREVSPTIPINLGQIRPDESCSSIWNENKRRESFKQNRKRLLEDSSSQSEEEEPSRRKKHRSRDRKSETSSILDRFLTIMQQDSQCYRNKFINNKPSTQTKDKNEKQVSMLSSSTNDNDKYIMDVKINNVQTKSHLDLGSQCSLVKLSTANTIGLKIMTNDRLPALRGIGTNLTYPIGVSRASVEIQGIKEEIDIYVVEDDVLTYPVLIGHSFTEKPNILITKTPDNIIFNRVNSEKIKLITSTDTEIPSNQLKPIHVRADFLISGIVYVVGSLRVYASDEYCILPGLYDIKDSQGTVLIFNISSKSLHINKDTLITRAIQHLVSVPPAILNSCTVSFETEKGDDSIWQNSELHKTTQKSPSELLFGFNITSRSEGILNDVINDTLELSSSEELNSARKQASDNIKKQQLKDSANFNKHRKPSRSYNIGDLVRVERQTPHDGKSQKLVVKYQGPYRISKILPNDRFLIEDTPLTRKNSRKYEAVVSIDKIQPWMIFNRNLDSDASSTDSNNE